MKINFLQSFSIIVLVSMFLGGNSQTKITITNGDWFDPAIWSLSGVPVQADSVIINTNVTFNQNLDARGSAVSMFRINYGASLKSISIADDTLILGLVDSVINNGEILGGTIILGDITLTTNNGTIKTTSDFVQEGNFNNKTGGLILVSNTLVTNDVFTNNGNITTGDWINAADVDGTTGKFCITDDFINSENINGTIDICDATPNTIMDINAGFIASSVTNCANGPCATGISGNYFNSETDIKIYPNPFTTTATIEICSPGITNCELTIYDLLGKEILKSKITNQKSEIQKDILPTGIYFYRFENEKNAFTTGKLIKN